MSDATISSKAAPVRFEQVSKDRRYLMIITIMFCLKV